MEDLELDVQILETLQAIRELLAERSAGKSADAASALEGLQAPVERLGAKIDTLTQMLGKNGEYRVNVSVEGADGAVHDLVSRVIEEVMVRVKQENILEVL